MTEGTRSIRLYRTALHGCGYYADRQAQNVVLDPEDPNVALMFETALEHGFRRAGEIVYRPQCPGCSACVPSRIDVVRFRPRRRHRRALAANADLTEHIHAARGDSAEHLALFHRYLAGRHQGGGMDDGDPDTFRRFLVCDWADTVFIDHRLDDRLVATAVTDRTTHALSAVYTFFDPAMAARSLGTYAILRQIAYAQRSGRRWLYLGYWIEGHRKMGYKGDFPALEVRDAAGRWAEPALWPAQPATSRGKMAST